MSEKLYDEVLAPKLKEIADICEANGIPFVALCEYEPGQGGRTEFVPDTACTATKIAAFAARCDGNVDALMIAIQRLAARVGHTSIALTLLNKPTGDSEHG